MQIVKVKYRKDGEFTGREYSYYSEETLKVGDIVSVPVKTGFNTAQVSAVDVPESEILPFKDAVKTIPAGSIIKQEPELLENPNISIEQQLTDGFRHLPKIKDIPPVFHDDPIFEKSTQSIEKESAHESGTAIININPRDDTAIVNLQTEIIKLSNYAFERKIKSDADLTPAGDDLILISKLKKALKDKQLEYVNPIKAHLDKVQYVFKDLLTCLDDIEKTNKAKISAYTDAQKAKVAEAEEINRQKEELAHKEAVFNGTGEITIDTTPVEAPAPVKKISTLSGSISEVKAPNTWELEDFDKVPNQYKILDTVRINQLVRAGGSIPGIKIITHTTIRTTTR